MRISNIFFSSSVFELRFFLTCQILKQQFNKASGFQVQMIFQNQILQQIYLSKKFHQFTLQKRQNWLFGAIMKSSVLGETELGRQVFFKTFRKRVKFRTRLLHSGKFWKKIANSIRICFKSFTAHQIKNTLCFFYQSGFDKNFALKN